MKDTKPSAEDLTALLTVGSAAVYTCEAFGDYAATYVSANVKAIVGYELNEFVSEPEFWASHIHPDDAAQVFEGLAALFEHDKHSHEYRFRIKDGGYIWMYDELRLIRDADGEPLKIIGQWHDVTQRKLAEEALRDSEQKFRVALGGSLISVGTTDRDLRYTWFYNPAVGFTPGSLVGKRDDEIGLQPEDAAALIKFKRGVLESGVGAHEEFSLRLPEGNSTFDVMAEPLRERSGAIIGLTVSATDITERKRAEELSVRFGRIIERSVNEVYVFDAETLKFIQVNQGARKNLGYTMKELATLTPLDFKPEFTLETFSESLRPLRDREKEQITFETIHKRKDGTTYEVEVRLQLSTEEVPPVFVAIIQDITKRKHLEEQLRQAQKMEAVGQLTAGVAHDFNNMLAVILGNAELLEDELGKDNPQLDTVFRTTERAADLTQRLLAFSRKQVLNPEVVNANDLIANLTDLLRRTLEEHIHIEAVASADLWNCEVDPAQLENALVNLALNARDAMPDGGKLTIEAANAQLDDDYAAAQADVRPGQYVMLAITDNGSGIPPEVREHVFEPFFTTKEVGAGSGLGLSMVYGFAKQSGGHVTIYSEPGEGTTIKLYLPRSTRTEAVERKPAADEAPVARGETVLVVEDDPDVRTLAVTLLSNLGYQILEAATGAAALEQLGSTTRVNLLLTDVMLAGGMNGRELATEAEQRAPGLPVLYMSGYTEDAILHHGRLDADAELLQKPFRRADLAGAVRKALDGPSA